MSDTELKRFAESTCGVFPNPQCSNTMQFSLQKNKGILLLGDALHAFPPDLGQGVNSGLEDVVELNNCLDDSNDSIDQV